MATNYLETKGSHKGKSGTWHEYTKGPKKGKRIFVPGGKVGGAGGAGPKKSLADRVKTDKDLLARALRDPGLRSKLPDRYLNPAQLASRKDRVFRSDLGDIETPLTGDSMINAANQLVDREFDPLFDDITSAEKTTGARRAQQQARASAYYGGINAQQDASVGGQVGANMQAIAGARDRGAAALGANDAVVAEATKRAEEDAARRGGDVGGGGIEELAKTAALQKLRTGQDAAAAETNAASVGSAQEAFMRGMQGATRQAGGEVQGQITARGDSALNELGRERTKLRNDRKGQLTDTLLKLRQGETETALTQRGLANDQEKALLDFKTEIAKLRTTAQIAAAGRRLKEKLTMAGLSNTAAIAAADRAVAEASNIRTTSTSRANTQDTTATSRRNTDARIDADRDNGAGGNFSSAQIQKAKTDLGKAVERARHLRQNGINPANARADLSSKYGPLGLVALGAIYPGQKNRHRQREIRLTYGIRIPKNLLR